MTCDLLFHFWDRRICAECHGGEFRCRDFFDILSSMLKIITVALDDRRSKNFLPTERRGRMNVLLRQERYDVCRIHLNKKSKKAAKNFFFFFIFRVSADAQPSSLVVLIATAGKKNKKNLPLFACFMRRRRRKKLFPCPLDDDIFFVVEQYNSNTAEEEGKITTLDGK